MTEPLLDLDRLGRDLSRAQDALLQRHGQLPQVRARLLSPRTEPRSALRFPLRLALATAVVLVLVTAMVMLWPRQAVEPSLTFVADRQPGELGRWMAPVGTKPLALRFSDGTRITLAAESGARVQAIDHHGGRILLEHGEGDFHVMPRPHARWVVEAGPFRVNVLGTRFQLSWKPRTQQLALQLHHGRVRLVGPVLGSRVIQSGEAIHVDMAHEHLALSRIRDSVRPSARPSASPACAAPRATTSLPTTPATPSTPPAKPSPAKPARPAPSLAALVRDGRYKTALASANRRGWPHVLQHASVATLQALGDAARLTGDQAQASRIYATIRRRFPGTDPAARSAFALGRLAFDTRRAHRMAASWFQLYLDEQPHGALAREALGRLLEARQLSGETKAARQAARSYLKQFPHGPHAPLARSLVEDRP